ncbi:MAG: hypothetical protein FWE34_07110 [Defluviitaleaceae bacterium]|nr:hypothetical protein [Defluviitaleaceae bacterium]
MKHNFGKPFINIRRYLALSALSLILMGAFFAFPSTEVQANANPPAPHATNGWNSGEGRFGPINQNDFHTSSWDRFGPMNYRFSTGPDWNQTFGRHTFAPNFTPDSTFQNVRRDRHASDMPLPYGIFSSIVATPMVNPIFRQSVFQSNQQQPFITQTPQISSFTNQPVSAHVASQNFTGQGSAWGQGSGSWGIGSGVSSPHLTSLGQTGGMLPHTSILD